MVQHPVVWPLFLSCLIPHSGAVAPQLLPHSVTVAPQLLPRSGTVAPQLLPRSVAVAPQLFNPSGSIARWQSGPHASDLDGGRHRATRAAALRRATGRG